MLKKYGYDQDQNLSNGNQQVYYRPTDKKLLYTVAGTHNLSDVGTDIYLGLGLIKNTNRYKEAKSTLEKAKQKYQPSSTTLAGHSLGGQVTSYIASKNDNVLTYNKGFSPFQRTRTNEKMYRTKGDLVSIFGANAKRTINLDNPNLISIDPLKAHNVDNIKNEKIFV
jgi:hypothetical protein